MLGECTQSVQCTSSNILNILFSNSTGDIFPGSWTAFCPAFFIYETSPIPISITTIKKTNTSTKITTTSTTPKIITATTSIKIAG